MKDLPKIKTDYAILLSIFITIVMISPIIFKIENIYLYIVSIIVLMLSYIYTYYCEDKWGGFDNTSPLENLTISGVTLPIVAGLIYIIPDAGLGDVMFVVIALYSLMALINTLYLIIKYSIKLFQLNKY